MPSRVPLWTIWRRGEVMDMNCSGYDLIPDKFRASDYEVRDIAHSRAKRFIERWHYSKGCSNTQVYGHALYLRNGIDLLGVAMWLPPTRVACESVSKDDWKTVISLTRLAIHPLVPKNGASFLIGASIKKIIADGRFRHLVTYADESQGHTGAIYRATNWQYVGRTGPYPRWHDPDGKQVAQKATVNRRKAEMEALGYIKVGSFYKHKFVIHLPKAISDISPAQGCLL